MDAVDRAVAWWNDRNGSLPGRIWLRHRGPPQGLDLLVRLFRGDTFAVACDVSDLRRELLDCSLLDELGRPLGARVYRAAALALHAAGSVLARMPAMDGDDQLLMREMQRRMQRPGSHAPSTMRQEAGLPESMPLLFAIGQEGGMVADLTLHKRRVLASTSTLFVRSPASYFIDLDDLFEVQLQRVQSHLLQRLGRSLDSVDWRLVWDIAPREAGLRRLSGPSAGAALLAASLYVARHDLPPNTSRSLKSIDWGRAAVTAQIVDADRGALGGVGDLPVKVQAALTQPGPYLQIPTVFVAAEHARRMSTRFALTIVGAGDIDELIDALVMHTNPTRLYGAYPDVVAEFARRQGVVDYGASRHIDRGWLNDRIQDAVLELRDSPAAAGIVAIQAPLGWGKTAWGLNRVRVALAMQSAREIDRLDGWAFASYAEDNGQGKDPARVSGNGPTLFKQLEACTRHRLAMPRSAGHGRGPVFNLVDFLRDCGTRAELRGRPVLLLLDGVDEALSADELFDQLPRIMPRGVVLIVTSRAGASDSAVAAAGSASRPVRIVDVLGDAISTADNERDLRTHVARRFTEIELRHGRRLEEAFATAVLHAAQGVFVVAAGLLRERADLPDELDRWVAQPHRLPRSAASFFADEIDQAVRKARGIPGVVRPAIEPSSQVQEAAEQLLGFLAYSTSEWSMQRLSMLLDAAFEAAGRHAAGKDAPRMLGALRRLSKNSALQAGLINRLGRLFGGTALNNRSTLTFMHRGMRDAIKERASGYGEALNRLWGCLCIEALADSTGLSPLSDYALRNGPRHFAAGGSFGSEAWLAAANLLQDMRPHGRGYLDRLFERDVIGPDAWRVLLDGMSAVLESVHRSPSTDHDASTWDLLRRLRSLQHALADQHEFVVDGRVPLVAALFNRQSGLWRTGTSWGDDLRRGVGALRCPWIRAIDPSPDLAHGASNLLNQSITAMGCSPDGRWIAVGCLDGQTWVWAREAFVGLFPGLRATRQGGSVRSVSITSQPETAKWLLVACASDGTLAMASCIQSEDGDRRENRSPADSLKLDPAYHVLGAALLSRRHGRWLLAFGTSDGGIHLFDDVRHAQARPPVMVDRHEAEVLDIALCGDENGAWWLASGGADGHVKVVECETDTAYIRERRWMVRHRFDVEHDGPVHRVALVADAASDCWLASACGQHTRIFACRDGVAFDLGQLATEHAGMVTGIDLRTGPGVGQCQIAAAGGADGATLYRIFDSGGTRALEEARVVITQGGWVGAVVLVPHESCDGRCIVAVGGEDRIVRIADDAALRSVETHDGRSRNHQSADFGPQVTGHSEPVNCAAVTVDSHTGRWRLASGSDDGTTRIAFEEDEQRGKGVSATDHGNQESTQIACLTVSVDPVSKRWWVASGCGDGTTRVAQGCDGRPAERESVATRHTVNGSVGGVTAIALQIDPRVDWRLASGDDLGAVYFVDAKSDAAVEKRKTRTPAKARAGRSKQVSSLAFDSSSNSPEGRLAVGRWDGTVLLIQQDGSDRAAKTIRIVQRAQNCASSLITAVAWLPGRSALDASVLTWGDSDGEVRLQSTSVSYPVGWNVGSEVKGLGSFDAGHLGQGVWVCSRTALSLHAIDCATVRLVATLPLPGVQRSQCFVAGRRIYVVTLIKNVTHMRRYELESGAS